MTAAVFRLWVRSVLLGLPLGLVIGVSPAMAGTCGAGKIVSVLEGGWDSNDFMIKLDYSSADSSHPGTEKSGWIVYKSTLDEQRINGIRAMALAAYISERDVAAFTHNGSCSDAGELKLQ